eukprot:TRINITY_DN5118_c0_g1_i4.p1 TRINITY_DN5118_c0_g1~~TRINITY_DN5118_c0_g1_i4.p1  ORF type:complete len:737 (+),score=150.46 TRINITY_DN5118_c0_g1_i4:198-2408(+)
MFKPLPRSFACTIVRTQVSSQLRLCAYPPTYLIGRRNVVTQSTTINALKGDVRSQLELAMDRYRTGAKLEAAKWFVMAAQQGNPQAQYNLGAMYMNGDGIQRNLGEALKLFKMAADQGLKEAQFQIGSLYHNGNEVVERDLSEAIKWYQLAAQQDFAPAKVQLQSLRTQLEDQRTDKPSAQDYERVMWVQAAAEKGIPEGLFQLGKMYYGGDGVPQDYSEAVRLWKLAAQKGVPEAQFNLGVMYDEGIGVKEDKAEAARRYMIAAKQNSPHAQHNLGWMYYTGQGVEQDLMEAAKWFTLAVQNGEPRALESLQELQAYIQNQRTEKNSQQKKPTLHKEEIGSVTHHVTVPESVNKKKRLKTKKLVKRIQPKGQDIQEETGNGEEKIKEEDGVDEISQSKGETEEKMIHEEVALDMESRFKIAEDYYSKVRDYQEKAISWYKLAAQEGHSQSQLRLADFYERGEGVFRNFSESLKWYSLAAHQGNPLAQFKLALMYVNGNGVEVNEQEAAKWCLQAAESGHPEAQFTLAVMYFHGKGVPLDLAKAAKLCLLASRQGLADAQYFLCHMYMDGRGVERDEREAARWCSLAAQQYHPNARYHLGLFYEHGIGVNRDANEAFKWFRLAAEQGNQQAITKLNSLRSTSERQKLSESTPKKEVEERLARDLKEPPQTWQYKTSATSPPGPTTNEKYYQTLLRQELERHEQEEREQRQKFFNATSEPTKFRKESAGQRNSWGDE